MKTNIITIIIGLMLTACGGIENGNVPTCKELDSPQGKQIAKKYLKGSWVDKSERSWGMMRFEYDGASTMHLWKKMKGKRGWEDRGLYLLVEIKDYKHTTTYGCTEFVFEFYNRESTMRVTVESMRGACADDSGGRSQYVHFK
jgi:hypothetical protein